MDEKLPKRKMTRWDQKDYSSEGRYFITICTQNRKPILSRISSVGVDVLDDPQIQLLTFGKIAEKYINQLNDFYNDLEVDQYVIMPNHIHLILFVYGNGPSAPTKQHSVVSRFVSTFKRFCNKEYGANIWQRSFYDHIIRDREDYQNHLRYIYENPLKWSEDDLFSTYS